MFTITGKQRHGAVWHEGQSLVTFVRGVATTNDPAVAEIVRAKGYTVTGEEERDEAPGKPAVGHTKRAGETRER